MVILTIAMLPIPWTLFAQQYQGLLCIGYFLAGLGNPKLAIKSYPCGTDLGASMSRSHKTVHSIDVTGYIIKLCLQIF